MRGAVTVGMISADGFANYSAEALAEFARCSLRTAWRWKKTNKLPAMVHACLAFLTRGDLGKLHADWQGFFIRKGRIETPEGIDYSPDEVRTIMLRLQHVAELEMQCRLKDAALEHLRNQVGASAIIDSAIPHVRSNTTARRAPSKKDHPSPRYPYSPHSSPLSVSIPPAQTNPAVHRSYPPTVGATLAQVSLAFPVMERIF